MYSKFLCWKKNQIPVDETTVCIKFKISNEHGNVCKVHFCHECEKLFLNKNMSTILLFKKKKLNMTRIVSSRGALGREVNSKRPKRGNSIKRG